MARKLVVVALGAAAAAVVLSARRRARAVEPSGNGRAPAGAPRLKRLVGEAAQRLRADAPG